MVWLRAYYWSDIYPKMGETGYRLGLQREYLYNMHFPFIDYGLDMGLMSQREQGMEMDKMERTIQDVKPTKEW